jgi:hypothetical protein
MPKKGGQSPSRDSRSIRRRSGGRPEALQFFLEFLQALLSFRCSCQSNLKIAYLSRIAFGHAGEANYRVFYNDISVALKWLDAPGT